MVQQRSCLTENFQWLTYSKKLINKKLFPVQSIPTACPAYCSAAGMLCLLPDTDNVPALRNCQSDLEMKNGKRQQGRREKTCSVAGTCPLSKACMLLRVFISCRGKELGINCCLYSASERQVVETNQGMENKCKEWTWAFRKGDERNELHGDSWDLLLNLLSHSLVLYLRSIRCQLRIWVWEDVLFIGCWWCPQALNENR